MTADPLLGEVLDGKYRVDAPLGSGGMGTVYRAMHLGTGREVALKVLVSELTANEAAVERFKREARTAGQMRHPNVVDVTDFGFAEQGGQRLAYLVMELLRGKTLRAVLEAEGRLPLDVAIDVLDQVCAAVEEAHKLGVLHRDLKPENIHLGERVRGKYRVKVLDFGIAKLVHVGPDGAPALVHALPVAVEASPLAATLPAIAEGTGPTMPVGYDQSSLTRLGAAIGTPRYMSPEQWQGRGIDARTDVYSLGIVAYEMLAGEPPFLGKERSIVIEHTEIAPRSLAERAPSVPRKIASVIEGALAKEPGARPPSVAAFAAGLQVGAETTGKLLRRSIELCADHYTLLFRRCWLTGVPPVVFGAIGVASGVLASHGLVPRVADRAVLQGVSFLGVALTLLLWAPVAGTLVPLVAALAGRGDSRPPPPSLAEIGRLAVVSLPSLIVMFLLFDLAPGLFLVPALFWLESRGIDERTISLVTTLISSPLVTVVGSAILMPLVLFPAVIVVEGARGLAPLRRSFTLVRPMLPAAFGVMLLYSALTQILPWAAQLAVGYEGRSASAPSERAILLLMWVSNMALQPFVLTPFAMLYLRAREAEGKPFG